MRTVTDRGVWVIVAAKARIAAGDRWASGAPDVFSDAALARKYRALWAFLARELRDEPFVAGVEVTTEPRNKEGHVTPELTPRIPHIGDVRAAEQGGGPGDGRAILRGRVRRGAQGG